MHTQHPHNSSTPPTSPGPQSFHPSAPHPHPHGPAHPYASTPPQASAHPHASVYSQRSVPLQKQPRRWPRRFSIAAAVLTAGLVGGAIGGVTTSDGAAPTGTTVTASAPSSTSTATSATFDASSLAAKDLPTVVEIGVKTQSSAAIGSGVTLDRNGDILTNAHVVGGGNDPQASVEIKTSDGHTSAATIIGVNASADLAVIRAQSTTGLTPATFADSSKVAVGDPVLAIGAPAGLENTVTSGIVSYLGREVTANGENGAPSVTYHAIQTDAAINPGNSGGPLIDAQGEVIGINSVIYSPTAAKGAAGSVGIGFAIPSNQASQIANKILSSNG